MSMKLHNIIEEYGRLINFDDIRMTLSSGETIFFRFKKENMAHLLGFQHIKDISLFYKYSENQISASTLLKEIKRGSISQDEINSSVLFSKNYENRTKYFTYEYIHNLLLNGNVSEFNQKKVRDFDTKLDKIDYIIWDNINTEYNHLGIGFSVKNSIGHPKTFFNRNNSDYVKGQKEQKKLTLSINNTENSEKKLFKIYWENIFDSLVGTSHYKKLERHSDIIGCSVKDITIEIVNSLNPENCDKENIIKEFNLFRLDKVKKIYEPYFLDKDPTFKWNNSEKLFIANVLKEKNNDLLPSEISVLLNDFRQKKKQLDIIN